MLKDIYADFAVTTAAQRNRGRRRTKRGEERVRKARKGREKAEGTEEGQEELGKKAAEADRVPGASRWKRSTGKAGGKSGLNTFVNSAATKAAYSASLCPVSFPSDDEWYEGELTADTGVCDKVVPNHTFPKTPMMPSLQSVKGMLYEVATGASFPNLGERRCNM